MTAASANLGVKQAHVLRLKQHLEHAEGYVGMLGRPNGRTGMSPGVGKVDKVLITTQIDYLAGPGEKSIHGDSIFDAALAEVIKEKFDGMAKAALARLRKQYEAELIEQHAELTAALAEIHALNAKAPTYVHVGNAPEAAPRHHRENLPLCIYKYGDASYSELWADHDQGWERLGELNRESFMKNGAAEYYIPTAAPVRNN
jgi:hypothetical protein